MNDDALPVTDADVLLAGGEGSRSPLADLSPPAEWSAAAIRLLQGVVYHDENAAVWESLLSNVSPLSDFFGRLGLLLVVDENDCMAYLRQPAEDDVPADYESLPRLFRRTPLSYDATLLCVLLRDELRQFEEEDVRNERCVLVQSDLLAVWQAFFPDQSDQVKLNRALTAALRKLEELKFVRQFEKEPPSWEIRRIIKARLPLSDLEQLRQSLVAATSQQKNPETAPPPEKPPNAPHESVTEVAREVSSEKEPIATPNNSTSESGIQGELDLFGQDE